MSRFGQEKPLTDRSRPRSSSLTTENLNTFPLDAWEIEDQGSQMELSMKDPWVLAGTSSTSTSSAEELPLGTILMWHKSMEARGGTARETGTATTDTADKLIDSSATFVTNSVAAGDIVYNSTDSTYATVQSVDSETELTLDWDAFPDGDEAYSVYPEPDIQPGFVVLDGSTIDDEDSPFDGMTVEDAVGSERFFRARETAGRLQADAFQGHQHHWTGASGGGANILEKTASNGTQEYLRGEGNTQYIATDDTNGTPRTADETRPVNLSIIPIVKIKNSGDVKLATYYSITGTDFKDFDNIDNLASGDVLVVWDNSASAYKTLPADKMNYFPPGLLAQFKDTGNQAGTNGAWTTYPLNTLAHNQISGASMASSQITLPAGTYLLQGWSSHMRVQAVKIRLYNVTAGSVIEYGNSGWENDGTGGSTEIRATSYLTLTQESVIELQYYLDSNGSIYELGYGSTPASEVVYGGLHILQINEREQTVTYSYEANTPPTMIVEDQKTTGGGNSAADADDSFHDRDLNTVVLNEIAGASLSSNHITLPAGSYEITAWSTVYNVGYAFSRFYNITDNTTPIWGLNNQVNNSNHTNLPLFGRVTISMEKTFALQNATNTYVVDGLGINMMSTFSELEYNLYSRVVIKKVA